MNNHIGIAGIANQATILPVKVLDKDGSGLSSTAADGIRYAADHGADVINMSFAAAVRQHCARRCGSLRRKGQGRCAVRGDRQRQCRCCELSGRRTTEVIGVGATDETDSRWVSPTLLYGSNYGPQVDLTAPGVMIPSLSTSATAPYKYSTGTSMASPHAAAVAALIRAKNPTWTRPMVEQQLAATALDLGAAGKDDYYGFGRVQSRRRPSDPARPSTMTTSPRADSVAAAVLSRDGSTTRSTRTTCTGFISMPAQTLSVTRDRRPPARASMSTCTRLGYRRLDRRGHGKLVAKSLSRRRAKHQLRRSRLGDYFVRVCAGRVVARTRSPTAPPSDPSRAP